MINIRQITTRAELRQFVEFSIRLYKGNDCYVPPIIDSEIDSLDSAVNPAFEFCESVYFMAYRDGKAVGRIAGIINHRLNEQDGVRQCRFGWVDFIDDFEVSRALLDAVAAWGIEKGMEHLAGPLGFTDLDYEGCLIEGHDRLATSATIYNYPFTSFCVYSHYFPLLKFII